MTEARQPRCRRMKRFVPFAIILATLLVSMPACLSARRGLESTQKTERDQTFLVVVEGSDGQMLGYEEHHGSINDFALTASRSDGSVVVTGIKDHAIRRELETTINQILESHQLPTIQLKSILKKRHVSCHAAMIHPPSRGTGFAGPGLLECADALVIGTTALSDLPIWKQRGLLMENNPKYAELIQLRPVPPRQNPAPATSTVRLVWEQAALFLGAVPKVEPTPTVANPDAVTLILCPTGNERYPETQQQPVLFSAALRALQRFVRESELNPKLIVAHTGPNGFAVDKLDPEIRNRLLELMQEELAQPTSPLSDVSRARPDK